MDKIIKKTVVLVFHDSGLSGGTLALLDLIEQWSIRNTFNYVCILPRNNEVLENKLKLLGCEVVVLRSWQGIWNGQDNFLRWIIHFAKLCLGLINTYIKIKHKIGKSDIRAVYSNTSSIYNGIIISKILRVPHIWHIREFVSKEHNVYPILGKKIHYKVLDKYSDQLIFISNSLSQEYKEHIKSENICTIYDDLSPKYEINEWKIWEERKNNIIVAGNISEGKSQATVIEALPQIIEKNPDVKLYLAGRATDDLYFERIKKMIADKKLEESVVFLGQVDNMNDLRKEMGIGIVASYKEAFGRVTIEGMLSGMLMVGANDSGTKELIDHGVNGYLFKLGDPEDLAATVNAALKKSNDANESTIYNAKEYAKKFIIGNCAQEIHDMLSDIGE